MNVNIKNLLQKKITLLQEFHLFLEQQLKALSENNFDQFNELLEKKQGVIEQINGLDEEIKSGAFERTEKGSGNTTGISGRDNRQVEIKELEQQIVDILQQIKSLDDRIRDSFEKTFNELARSVSELQIARRTEEAYHKKNRRVHSFFINKKR